MNTHVQKSVLIPHVPGMPGWIDIGSDVNWEDHGGRWAKKARDGSWYVLRVDESENVRYVDVKRVVLADIPASEVASALRSCGCRATPEGLCSDQGDLIEAEHTEVALVEMLTSYGLGAPMFDDSTDKPGDYAARCLRAKARREAETMMRDAARVETLLDRPVNKIGSTAREYGAGDITSALDRGIGSDDPLMKLMQKFRGMPTLGGGVFGERAE